MSVLDGLQPEKVFEYFECISAIPRCSGHEKAISDYIAGFAYGRGLAVFQDEALNVIIKKPASQGRDSEPPLILQGHMDMVGEKRPSSKHDFLTDALTLKRDHERIFAEDTTLGADNGIAVAMMLALLDDQSVSHPPIEAVFTTGEEDALDGANALDCSKLSGKRMINLDSEQEGEFIVGCAGGCVTEVSLKPMLVENPASNNLFELDVKGLLGGHSGVDINKSRGNANVLLGRVLNKILPQGVFLSHVEGGSRDNVIPNAANALIAIPKEIESEVRMTIEALAAVLKLEYRNTDPAVILTLSRRSDTIQPKVFSGESALRLSQLLIALPCGVLDMSTDIKGVVETSNSVAIIRTNSREDDATVSIINSTRSSVASRKAFAQAQICAVAALSNATTHVYGHYPGWAYAKESPIRESAVALWHRFSGCDAHVTVTHGGLECGIFVDKIPYLDVVSFGPNITNVHSPDESMEIASVARVWSFLIALLKEI